MFPDAVKIQRTYTSLWKTQICFPCRVFCFRWRLESLTQSLFFSDSHHSLEQLPQTITATSGSTDFSVDGGQTCGKSFKHKSFFNGLLIPCDVGVPDPHSMHDHTSLLWENFRNLLFQLNT